MLRSDPGGVRLVKVTKIELFKFIYIYISAMIELVNRIFKQSIPVECIPPACILYMLQWPPPDVTPGSLSSDVQIGHQMSLVGEGISRSDVQGRGYHAM